MSAEKVGHTPTIYELKANDGLAPFRVVMEQDYWRLLGRFQLLLALAKRYASECSDAGLDNNHILEVIRKAEGK